MFMSQLIFKSLATEHCILRAMESILGSYRGYGELQTPIPTLKWNFDSKTDQKLHIHS